MARVKRGVAAQRRRKRILKAAKGYQGARSRLHGVAREAVERSWAYAYRDRKQRKRAFRQLWIARINAGARGFLRLRSSLVPFFPYSPVLPINTHE